MSDFSEAEVEVARIRALAAVAAFRASLSGLFLAAYALPDPNPFPPIHLWSRRRAA